MAAPIGGGKPTRLVPSGEGFEETLRFIEEMTANCDEVQRRVLGEILTQNGGTEYLLRHGLGGSTDRATFKTRIPVVSYEELRPEIQRVANGDASAILSGRPVTEFLTSSGTSGGERKLMPCINEDLDRTQMFYNLNAAIINKYIPGLDQGMRLNFMFVKSETKTPGGLPARPAITSYYKSDHFQSRLSGNNFTSPAAAILCTDPFQSMYTQLLCGLLHRLHVLTIGSVFASGLLRAIHFLQTHWPDLAHDIATGTLSASITTPSLRASVADILRPDPDLSRFITDECMKPDWASIITRIWPKTKYIAVVTSGTMAQYIPTLEFYGGGLPLVSSMYGSSECLFGLNFNPMCPTSEVAYTIVPNMGYFEFIESGKEGAGLVDLSDVEVGKEYELVVTTYAGMYRYRVGDVLQVVKFHNAAPQFKFLRRKDVLLSIESDKTDENELQRAVEAAAKVLSEAVGASLVDYTSQACTKTVPGHYVIYWELLWHREEGSPELGKVMEKCCLAMEEEMNSVYRQSRVENRSIGPLEIRIVRCGTFEELMDYAISRGASINQYKAPRCVGFEPILELLDSRIVSTHFSVGLPRWNPR